MSDDKDALMLGFKVHDFVKEKIEDGSLFIDFNGHYKNGRILLSNLVNGITDFLFLAGTDIPLQDLQALATAFETDTEMENWVEAKCCMLTCSECNNNLKIKTNGKVLKLITEDDAGECEYPNGLGDVEIELNIPSGKLVVGNDFRHWFPVLGGCTPFDVNTNLGIVQTIQAYEKVGMGHGFCGNTCPSVFKQSSQKITISDGVDLECYTHNYLYDHDIEDEDQLTDRQRRTIKAEHDKRAASGEKVGSICTDLWWYSVVDYDEFKRRFNYFNVENGKSSEEDFEKVIEKQTVVEVDPGVYKLTHYMDARNNADDPNHPDPVHYAVIERVREPDPLVDYVQREKDLNFTAGQAISHRMNRYRKTPVNPETIANYGFSLMTDTRWDDWHINGWCGMGPDDTDVPDLAIPEFKGKMFPSNRFTYSALAQGSGVHCKDWGLPPSAKFMNSSFVELSFNLLQNIIRYGVIEPDDERFAKTEEQDILLAKICFLGLNKKYPNSVPEYCADLLEELKTQDLPSAKQFFEARNDS